MTDRCAVLLLSASLAVGAPRGVSAAEWRSALAEDVVDVLANLEDVTGAVAAVPPDEALAQAIVWPDTPVFIADTIVGGLLAAAEAGFAAAAVVAPDVPDLPPMHIAKLFRALGSHPVAAAPAAGGGLVALAATLPVPEWLVDAEPSLDSSLDQLRAAAPTKRAVAGVPGWHRLRTPADIPQLDPGLEGWESTRAVLGY